MSEKKAEVIIVDAGNTRIKAAAFLNGKILEIAFLNVDQNDELNRFLVKFQNPPIFVSSVISNEDLGSFLGDVKHTLLSLKCKLPVKVSYDTPNSLGLDRLANSAAIQSIQPLGNKVSIDIGTCLKFDVVNKKGEYLGGSISPGLRMRYKALNHFTGKLPLLEPRNVEKLIGTNTQDSIHSGVINGMKGEINQFILSYSQQYQDLTFFVTGGDANYFEFDTKNNIFADENLTLLGLYYIYQKNA